jgi:hypothetical protein
LKKVINTPINSHNHLATAATKTKIER